MIKVKASEVAMAKIVPQFDQTREDSDKPAERNIENLASTCPENSDVGLTFKLGLPMIAFRISFRFP